MQLNLPSTLWKPEKSDKIEIFLKKENMFEAPEGYQGSEELRSGTRNSEIWAQIHIFLWDTCCLQKMQLLELQKMRGWEAKLNSQKTQRTGETKAEFNIHQVWTAS